jgi:collagenase-like PrtC family protease
MSYRNESIATQVSGRTMSAAGKQPPRNDQNPDSVPPLELLAPAGDEEALQAALEAGATAVYFGLPILNARRRAPNFTHQQLPAAVQAIHARGARAYLTLNVDIAERELEIAARVLELAHRTGCDAVLVRDPALLALHPAYPSLDFHFSTQSSVANSADLAAVGILGAARAVLAREMTLSEIAAAGAHAPVETEVFVQGALCFSVSGRCLLSSWVGGRSGNRGQCASPCRVPWSISGEPHGTPLSMQDLSALERLPELQRAGVRALKIEGRMKNAAWVRRAVSLYRRALDGEPLENLREEVQQLGEYTGRQMTSGYLDGQREGLTGAAGRPRSAACSVDETEAEDSIDSAGTTRSRDSSTYELEVMIEDRGVHLRCQCAGIEDAWTIPKTVIHRPHKAVSVETLSQRLSDEAVHGCSLARMTTNDPEFRLVPRAVNAVIARISKTVQRGRKNQNELIVVKLPADTQVLLKKPERHPVNQTALGNPPDRARLNVASLEEFLRTVRPGSVIVEGITADNVRAVRNQCRRTPLIVALPAVFFEDDLDALRKLLAECARSNLIVEVNSWGGWHLAKEAGVRVESGPGLAVLNSLAARVLAKAGIEGVTLSVEGDRRQFEELTAYCPLPSSLYVFGRPALMISRVQLPDAYVERELVDRRNTRLVARREQGLWVLRPEEPFDLRNLENERIRVKHLVVDLVGSPDPVDEWQRVPSRGRVTFHFNYERGLV